MSGRLKPYFYFVLCMGAILDSLQQAVETIYRIWDCERIRQDFTLGTDDEAIVFIFRDIDTNRNHHNRYLQR